MIRILLILTALVLTGCRMPLPDLPPRPWSAVPVQTTGGPVIVQSRCPEVDLDRVRLGLEIAWERGVAEEPEVVEIGWSGLHFVYDPIVRGDDRSAYYDYTSSGVRVACGTYEAVSHYPGHHWCLSLGRDCCGQVWHEGFLGGRDLRCERLP